MENYEQTMSSKHVFDILKRLVAEFVATTEHTKTNAGRGCAYCTLVMQGDSYIPGAVVLAHSIRKLGTQHQLVCMVTADVTPQGRATLLKLYDRLVDVDYLEISNDRLNFGHARKNMQLYRGWLGRSFTKLHALGLGEYRRVLFLDADMIVVKSLDHVFDYEHPVVIFSSWARKQNHNLPVPQEAKLKYLSSHPARGSFFMVKPSAYLLHKALMLLQNYDKFAPFKTEAGPVELLLSLALWNNMRTMHRGYSVGSYNYAKYGLSKEDVFVYDLIGEKPWNVDPAAYKDYADYQMFYALLADARTKYRLA